MPIVEIQGLGNVEFPDTMSQEDIVKAIQSNIMPKIQATQPAVTQVGQPVSPTALTPPPPAQTQDPLSGAFGRSLYNIGADINLLKGKITGDTEEAERRAKELKQWGSQVYKDTEQGWSEAPGTKIAELFGGSLPYMVAPAAAAILTPAASIGLGLTAADIAAGLVSATQFTGSNLARQTDNEKKTLAEASLLNAGMAAIPQAALDVTGLKFIPGIRRIFGEAGQKITEEAAEQLVKKSILAKAGSVALQTGKTMGVEGATEAGQQLFERLQAGLSITDADARKEYYDNFIGGAVLGGVMAGPGIGLEKMIDTNKKTEEQQLKDLIKELDKAKEGELAGTYNIPPETTTPPAEGVPPAPPASTTPPQPNVVTPEQLLSHATTRIQELETKVAGTETTPPQPLTPQEQSEYDFLKSNTGNAEALAQGYGVSIGKPRVTGSQDVEGALGELDGKPIEVPPIFQPPVETAPPVETQPAEPEVPPTPETPPVEEAPPVETKPEEKPPVEEAPPTVVKEPPKVEPTGRVIDSNGQEHSLPTVSDAETAGFTFFPINKDKPMYYKTDLEGIMSMLYNLFGDKNYTSYTNMASSKYKVTSDKNKVLPKTSNKNQVSVEFRPDTLSGRQLNDDEFFADDTAHRAIESFTIHNPTSKLSVSGVEARLGTSYLKRFFNVGNNPDGSITYTLKRVKSETEKEAENERLSKEYLEHINRPRGKLKYRYTRKRKPGLNEFQQSINQHENLGEAFKDVLARLENALVNNEFREVSRDVDSTVKTNVYRGKDPALHGIPYSLTKEQTEMYVDIIKHLMKIDPVMKTHLFMDPYIVGGKYSTTVGFYNRVSTTLALFANANLPTLVHEAIHAATVHYIEMHPNDPKVTKLKQILQESRKRDKKTRGDWKLYGNTNLKEFIAEAFSDVEFITHLKSIDPIFDKSESTSVFDNIKNIVAKMMQSLGINVNKDRSAFDEVMDLSSELFTGKTLEGYKYDLGHPLDAETESMRPAYESIKAKPGANVGRLEKMFGPQLYGSMESISEVSVKEMFQNSFDAIKTMIEKGVMTRGNINIDMDEGDRSIKIKDNGSGMTPDVIQNTFFTIAGTNKETEFGSGAFGVAKMLFLFNNQNIELITMRDGKISSLSATGEQLKASLEDPSQAPNIEVIDASEYDQRKLKENFPDGHGTIIRVVVPKTFTDPSTGKTEDIPFVADRFDHSVLRFSPLFANIEVKFNKEILSLGSAFEKEDYTTFVDADFYWGTARIYVSTYERDKYGKNLHVLSNGLWQFSEGLTKKPGDRYADNIPYRFYVDIVSKVKPEEQGYPFLFNRQGFTKEASADIDLVKNYLWLNYTKKDLASTSTSFGNVHYLTKKNGKINVSAKEDLNPEVNVQEISDGIKEGSNVKVVNGKLIVNGKEIPALNPQDLKNATIDLDELKIPQDKVKSNDIMVHDNLAIEIGNEVKPITELAKEKFGGRFDQFMYEIGDVFKTLRDRLVYLNVKGDLPNYDDVGYKDLADHAIGISFDKEYRGVSIKLPFNGMFINPALPEFTDPEGAGYGMFGTMIHELAHYQVRNHESEFPAEMQRLNIVLKRDKDFDINGLERELVHIVVKNKDILNYLNDLGVNYESQAIGQRFKDSEYERATKRTAQDISKSRGQRQLGREVSSDLESRNQITREMRQPQPISSEIKTDEGISESTAPLDPQQAQEEQGSRQIFNYRGDPVDIRKWEIPERGRIATALSKWYQQFADEHVTITKVQNAIKAMGRSISDMSDAEKKQELKNSRISDQLLRFANEEVNPILKEMLANNVSLEEIKEYLHARHAEAYNNRMNDINHRVDADGNIIPYDLKDRASGMHTDDANRYLNNLSEERRRTLEAIADKWYAIRDKTQELLVESGQETQETIDLWRETFPDYVPLNREQEQQAVPSGLRTGVGIDVRGNFAKRAMGSEKAIINPIDAILYQRERAVARAENNNVGKAVYRLALENPQPDFWMAINPDAIHSREKLIQELADMGYPDPEGIADNIMAEPKERYLRKVRESDFVIDPTTGLPIPNSKEVVDARISRNARFGDNVLTLKINGRERYVFFNQKNPDAVTMVRTLKNLDSETLGRFLSLNRFVNHYFGQLYTVLNPIFGIVNGLRDYPFGMANLSTTPIRGKQLQVSAKIFPAMRGIMGVLRQERASDGSTNSEWQRIYKEATEAGFQTSNRYAILNTGEDKSYIEQTLNQFKDGNSKKAFRYIIGMTYDFASMIENGVRLAAYQQMREAGYTPQQSASVAKNLTINFDKKGARTGALRSLYLFFNASVRGTVRLAETLSGPSGGRIIAGGMLLGVMQAMMMAAAGFKDDDPPEYIREHNLIIPTGDGKYITIPMPYGLNILPNTGRIFTEYALDVDKNGFQKAKAGKKAMAWTNSLFSTFSPFGNQGLSINALVPSAVEPIVGVGLTNKNSFGQTISRQDSYTRPTPGYLRTKESGTSAGKEFARWMNLFTGGTDYAKGVWSPTGDDIDFLVSSVTGPVVGSVAKTIKYGKAKMEGKEVPAYQTPVLGRFEGELDSKPVITSRFYNNINAMYEHELTLKNLSKDPVAKREYIKEHPEARAYKFAEQYEARINDINATKKKFQMAGRPQEQIDRLDNKKIILMNRFNDQLEKIKNQ